MSTISIISLIVNGILATAAVAGVLIAKKGLSTWRDQLRGHEEYALARRILVRTYQLRDAFRRVRNPAMWASEMPVPPREEAANMDAEEISFWGVSKAYQSRWDRVNEIRENLDADLLESDVVWGPDLKRMFDPVIDLEKELWHCVYVYLKSIDPRSSAKMREAYDKLLAKQREILYGNPKTDDGDEFAMDLREAIQPIETYLKPKLRQ